MTKCFHSSSPRVVQSHQEVIGPDSEQVPEVLEADGGVDFEPELGVVMCRRVLAALAGERHRLDRVEVAEEDVAPRPGRLRAERVRYPQLDSAHDGGRLNLTETPEAAL